MKKRIVSVLLASVLTMSCLAGCGGGSGEESAPADNAPAAETTENSEGGGQRKALVPRSQ